MRQREIIDFFRLRFAGDNVGVWSFLFLYLAIIVLFVPKTSKGYALSPGTNGYPAPFSTVSVPSACATAECGPLHWVIAAYADLAFEQ